MARALGGVLLGLIFALGFASPTLAVQKWWPAPEARPSPAITGPSTEPTASPPVEEGTPRRLIIQDNDIEDSAFGIYLGNGQQAHEILIVDNLIRDNGEGIRVMGVAAPHQIRDNRIVENIIGVKILETYSHNKKGLLVFPDMAISRLYQNEIRDNDQYGLLNETPRPTVAWGNDWGPAARPLTEAEMSQRQWLRTLLGQVLVLRLETALNPASSALLLDRSGSSRWAFPLSVSMVELLTRRADRVKGPVRFAPVETVTEAP